jgi:hypothetical protein
MKKLLFITILPSLMFGVSISELAVFNTKVTNENKMASENEKIKCRYVCDKKVYKEQKIAEAVSFYKNSKNYKFSAK